MKNKKNERKGMSYFNIRGERLLPLNDKKNFVIIDPKTEIYKKIRV